MNSEKETQMQDDELYALLDSVMEDERLTVREELIQATLQRVKEEEAGLIPVKKSGRKLYRILSYAGMAAAAVLVLFVGVTTVNNGGFTGKNMKAESIADSSQYMNGSNLLTADSVQSEAAESKTDGKKQWFYSVADDADGAELQEPSDMAPNAVAPEEKEEDIPERGGDVLTSDRVMLSAGLQKILSGTDKEETVWAECFVLRQRKGNWQEELLKIIEACAIEGELPEEGAYDYALTCNDGTLRNIKAETPLDLIVRIETDSGELWGFFGESVRAYRVK